MDSFPDTSLQSMGNMHLSSVLCWGDTQQRSVTKKCIIFACQENTLQYGLRSVHYYGAKCWNNISLEIKSLLSAYSSGRKLKAFLFENNYQPKEC